MITIDYELRIICKYMRTPQESCLSRKFVYAAFPFHPFDISQNLNPFRSYFKCKFSDSNKHRYHLPCYIVAAFTSMCVASDLKFAPSMIILSRHFSAEIQPDPSFPGKSPHFQLRTIHNSISNKFAHRYTINRTRASKMR